MRLSQAAPLATVLPCWREGKNVDWYGLAFDDRQFRSLGESLTAFVGPTEATGTVTFSDRSTALGSGRVIAGTASLSTSQLAAGAQPITASYGGDDNYAGSTSPAIVQLVDTPPLAAPDAYAVLQNRTLVVESPGVLANDTDIDGNQPLTAQLVNPPSWAAPDGFTLNADGSFTYVPRAGFTGVDTFTLIAVRALACSPISPGGIPRRAILSATSSTNEPPSKGSRTRIFTSSLRTRSRSNFLAACSSTARASRRR